jgi:alkanesulfonate monooxygenase SsuD/methylene tetrahydromethanopterin reductase-like flavin-dependent oxidoreductase (luciferase family)
MEIGAFRFADVSLDPRGAGPAERLPELIEQITLADEVGLDVFGIGEHHCADFATPAPAALLAVAADRTSRIRLSGTVTVLGREDPAQVVERFTTLDGLSDGRAEIIAGTGGLSESFRIFGCQLHDDDRLFSKRLDILLAQRTGNPVHRSGHHRSRVRNELVRPRHMQEPLPVWLAADGSPDSIVRAGQLGLPLALGIEGRRHSRLASMLWLYQDVLFEADYPPCPVAITVHGFVADTSQRAADLYYPFDAEDLGGAYLVGSPEEVTEHILRLHETFGHQRTLLQLTCGGVGHCDLMRAIELLGTEVAPAVRTEIARREAVGSIPPDGA